MIKIRLEQVGDETAVYQVNEAALGRPDEAELVNMLRQRGVVTLSLVAEQEGEIVGHILFSPVTITNEQGGAVTAVGLGPLAVSPHCQREGIASQ